MPKVSVLIPTYNSAIYLDEAIQSVLHQTFQDYELIIVDNQSTDNTDEVVSKYLTNNKVAYYKNETNIGMAGNWNQCLQYASGEYIKLLCSDDKFHPQLLEKFVAVLDDHPTVSVVTSYKIEFGDKDLKVETPFSLLQPGENMIAHSLARLNWIGEPSTVMFRKKHLWIGHFKTELKWITDWDMWLRLLKLGDLYIVPEHLSYFRFHSNQATKHLKKSYVVDFEEYYYLNTLQDFDFSPFVHTNEFIAKKKKAARKCFVNTYFFYKNGNKELAKKALEIGYRERLILNVLYSKIASKFKK